MRTLPLCFKFMKIGGLWLPTNCSVLVKFLYNFYSLIIICILYTFTLSEIIDLFVNLGAVEDFASNSFLLLTMIGISCKATDIMGRRQRFKRLIDFLFDELCQPCNVEEEKIQNKCAEACRKTTRNYVLAILPTVMLLTLGPLVNGFNNPVLPFRGWQPYSLASRTNFWLTYSYQALAFKVATIISISYDTLIPVLMIQTCGQLDILKFRLHNLSNAQNYNGRLDVMEDHERNHLRMCVCHHNHIIRFSKELQDFFNPVMSLQCFVSLIALCSNIYLLSRFASFSVKFITLLFYFSSLLLQLFIYCWYGNEVILQSSDIGSIIFQIDWLLLRNSTRKDLTIVMLRADMGIKYTCGGIVTMSLGTYMSILKTSYSVFNVLQQL